MRLVCIVVCPALHLWIADQVRNDRIVVAIVTMRGVNRFCKGFYLSWHRGYSIANGRTREDVNDMLGCQWF